MESLVRLKIYQKKCNVRRDRLYRMLERGALLTAVKIGRFWYIDPDEPLPKETNVRTYKRFTYTDRLALEKLLKTKSSVSEIAASLEKTPGAVYLEIKRGMCEQLTSQLETVYRYCADTAEAAYRENVQLCGGDLKIGNDKEYADFLERVVAIERYSPNAALAKAREAGYKTEISVNTFYNYIDRGVFKSLTREQLPCGAKKKRKYNKVKKAKRAPSGESIEKRPAEVAARNTFGHWEMDTVHGKADTKATLLVLTERLSRFELIIKMRNNKTSTVVEELNKLKRKHGNYFSLIFKSITVDNGSEFADCDGLQSAVNQYLESTTKLYYCHPFSSFERGSNENANKLVRRWVRKGSPIEKYSHKTIKFVQDWINNYPRKIFNWKSSAEIFEEHIVEIKKYHSRN